MPKTREYSDFERGMIIGLHKGEHSPTDISRIVQIPRTTINSIIKKYEIEGATSPDPRPGRPPLLKDIDERHFIRTTKANNHDSLEQITQKFNELDLVHISTSTARRVLHKNDYYGRVAKRKPFVSEVNRKKRLRWCKERKFWALEWDDIIWSDESRFTLFENDGQHWVWRQPHEKYDVNCLAPTFKSNNEGVMVWGCFTKNRLGPLVVMEGRITGQVYIELLENHLLPFIESLDDDITFIFQDDNASVHRAGCVIEFKEEYMISSLPWPAQSPDLNPIEHLWDVLGRKVHEHIPHPKNRRELIAVLEEEWNNIEPDVLENLVNSMPNRVQAVIQSHGNPTMY